MHTPIPPRELSDRLVARLLDNGCTLLAYDTEHAVLSDGNLTLLILQAPTAFEHLPSLGQIGNAEVLLLGGGPEVRARLHESRPWLTRGQVHLIHLDDDDVLDGPLDRLGPLLRQRHSLPEPDPEHLAARIAEGLEHRKAQLTEAQRFQRALSDRTPVATFVLTATIALYFALEMLWGGFDSLPTLVRMGALVRERALVDESWRLLSCTFLHGSVMHVAVNAYVLVALGMSLERILGHQRFLILYVASALGGSLASTIFLGTGISVGASGAVWGLLAAEAVLALRPAGILPAVMLPALKRAALLNLGLNLANSFRPDVDWAAHLGGGVVGAILVATGLLTVGLPRLAELSADATPTDRKPGWLPTAAILLTGMLIVGGALGPIMGRPWTLTAAVELVRRPVGDSGLQVDLPSTMTEREQQRQGPGQLAVVYGDLDQDPASAEVFVVRLPDGFTLTGEQKKAELETMEQTAKADPPPQSKLLSGPRWITTETTDLLLFSYGFDNGLLVERAIFLTPQFGGLIDVAMWPEGRAAHQGLAERAARSLGP